MAWKRVAVKHLQPGMHYRYLATKMERIFKKHARPSEVPGGASDSMTYLFNAHPDTPDDMRGVWVLSEFVEVKDA